MITPIALSDVGWKGYTKTDYNLIPFAALTTLIKKIGIDG